MLRKLKRCAALMGVALVELTAAATPLWAAPPGSYLQTCRNVQQDGGNVLRANCDDGAGRLIRSTLDLAKCGRNADIANIRGRLRCAVSAGSYEKRCETQGSCRDMRPLGDFGPPKIVSERRVVCPSSPIIR